MTAQRKLLWQSALVAGRCPDRSSWRCPDERAERLARAVLPPHEAGPSVVRAVLRPPIWVAPLPDGPAGMTAWIDWFVANAHILVPLIVVLAAITIHWDRHPETAERICDRIAL